MKHIGHAVSSVTLHYTAIAAVWGWDDAALLVVTAATRLGAPPGVLTNSLFGVAREAPDARVALGVRRCN